MPFYEWQSSDYDWNPNPDLLPIGSEVFGTTEFNASGFENLHDTGCGGYGCGSIYRTDGATLTTLHRFTGTDGGMPIAGLMQSGKVLYGSTSYGGGKCATIPEHCGTVFAFSLTTKTFKTLRAFTGLADGGGSYAKPVLFNGSLYGTTAIGGTPANVAARAAARYLSWTSQPANSPHCMILSARTGPATRKHP